MGILNSAGYSSRLFLVSAEDIRSFKVCASSLVISPIFTPEVEEVTELSDTVRGEGGFGSTGK